MRFGITLRCPVELCPLHGPYNLVRATALHHECYSGRLASEVDLHPYRHRVPNGDIFQNDSKRHAAPLKGLAFLRRITRVMLAPWGNGYLTLQSEKGTCVATCKGSGR